MRAHDYASGTGERKLRLKEKSHPWKLYGVFMSGFQKEIVNVVSWLRMSVVSRGSIRSSRNSGYRESLQNTCLFSLPYECSSVAPEDSEKVIRM